LALEQAAKNNDMAMKEIIGLDIDEILLKPLIGYMNFLKNRNH